MSSQQALADTICSHARTRYSACTDITHDMQCQNPGLACSSESAICHQAFDRTVVSKLHAPTPTPSSVLQPEVAVATGHRVVSGSCDYAGAVSPCSSSSFLSVEPLLSASYLPCMVLRIMHHKKDTPAAAAHHTNNDHSHTDHNISET